MTMLGNHLTTTFESVQCCKCSIWFGIDTNQNNRLLERGGNFYCPNGHSQQYTTPEVVKLRQRVKSLEAWSDGAERRLEAERKSHSATKGQLTKTKNRIAAGVCVECHRHFANVERHMHTKHPDLIGGKTDE